jgi:hypothetical protein
VSRLVSGALTKICSFTYEDNLVCPVDSEGEIAASIVVVLDVLAGAGAGTQLRLTKVNKSA